MVFLTQKTNMGDGFVRKKGYIKERKKEKLWP